MNLKPGVTLHGGSYRIIDTLGRGGFGITYLAEQVMAKRKVCIKEFFPKDYYNRDSDTNGLTLSSDGFAESMNRFKAKFIKEAQTIASLDHSNIIHIHDAFEENGTAYYVMEYVEGGSLRDIIKEQGPLSESDAKRYIRAVASALSYIHEQKINHLDVKPGNIMVRTKDDSAILIDFGLAKHYDIVGDQTSSTPVGISHGYAPIEQYTSGGVREFSPSTDIYGLGATLYFLVTGLVPPHATDVGEEGLPKLPDHLSQGVHKAIERSMQYWRKDRPQSVKEFLKLLDDDKIVAPVAEATIINVETKSVDESTVINVKPKQTPQPTPQPKNEPKPKKSKRGMWLGIFLFILAAVASFILFGGGSSKKESAPKSAVATVDTLASSNDSLNLAKPGVDTLQLNEQSKEEAKPSEVNTETETKPEPPRNPGIRNETGSNFVSLSSNGGSGSIKYSIVNGNGSEVTYTNSGSSWLKSAKGAGKIEYSAGANTTGSERSATIKVMYANKSFEVIVTQSAAPVLTPISATNETIKADGGSIKIKYTITNPVDGASVKYATDAKWLTLKPNDGVVSCTAQANTTDKKRSATVTLTYCDQSVNVNISQDSSTPPNNEIWYTSPDGKVVKPREEVKGIFGAEIESNTYKNGKGIIKFSGNITTIGEYAFYTCYNLTSVTIPNSVTTIGEWAFGDCKNLTSVTIPNSVTTIGKYAFYDCDSLKEFKSKFASKDGRCLIINGELVAFTPAGISEYTIPNSVTTIGKWAFAGCDSLKSVTIPNSVTTIGAEAFAGCDSLTSVTIPNSVTTIGKDAFAWCSNLKSVTIPNSVKTIGESAFNGCESLTSVTIPNSVTTIGESAFYECKNLTSVTIPNSVTTIGGHAFTSCSSLTSITIPNSVKTIGEWAFACCGLTSVTIPNSVTTIDEFAFYGNDYLNYVYIPNSVKFIGDSAFGRCNNLQKSVVKKIESINYNAYY